RSGARWIAAAGPIRRSRPDLQKMRTAPIGPDNAKHEVLEHHLFARTRDTPQLVSDQPANGVELLVAEMRAEVFVEMIDRHQRTHRIAAIGVLHDVARLALVVFILDIADD